MMGRWMERGVAMNKISHSYFVGRTERGWLAVSQRAPYFCFEGDTEDDVANQAQRALDFYFGVRGQIDRKPPQGERTKTLSTFSPKRAVKIDRNCVDA